MNTIKTASYTRALRLASSILQSSTRIGRITGSPGTGKSYISKMLLDEEDRGFAVYRVCASEGITKRAIIQRIVDQAGAVWRGSTDVTLDGLLPHLRGQLLIVDEANHLGWRVLETLRYITDEGGAGLMLVGTELSDLPFTSAKTAVLLQQLKGRIGAKQIKLGLMSAKEVAGYVLVPRFGAVSQDLAKSFHKATRGNWRECAELADACQRVMTANRLAEPSADVLSAAIHSMSDL